MNQFDIGLMRLCAQHILKNHDATPGTVVKHLLAMQAQDYSGALWSIGLRTQNSSVHDVEESIRDHTIVRTWPMRGTLHFLHADDIHWMLEFLAPRATAAARRRRINTLGLTDTIVNEAEAVLRSELKGGRSIVRNHVVEILKAGVKGTPIDNQHTQHLMRNFGERGIICFGPNEGKQPTFVLLDEWVPKTEPKPRTEALRELALRYFTSHGPATLKDFSGWSMLTMGDAKIGLAAAESDLMKAALSGVTYYYAPGLAAVSEHEALLLSGFDEYLLGYKDRSAVLASEHANKIVPGNNGMFLPTIVENGRVVGMWKREMKRSGVTLTYNAFAHMPDVSASEKRYSNFMVAENEEL